MKRVFLAFEVPEPSKAAIFEVQTKLQRAVRSQFVKWIPESRWHITVQFIGDVDDVSLEQIKNVLHDVRPRSIDLQCWCVNVLPMHSSPRNLVLQFADSNGTAFALRDWWAKSIGHLGILADTRAWVPHVTLGRIRAGRQLMHEFVSETHVPKTLIHVRALTLFDSKLTHGGATYHPLSSIDMLA